jgi:hypothetical protein
MTIPNYDLDALELQADFGDGWENINGHVVSLSIDHTIEADTLNFSPTAGTATATISTRRGNEWFGNVFATPFRVRFTYAPGEVATLFAGTVRGVSATASPGERPTVANTYAVTIQAVSAAYDLSKRHLAGFSRGAESGQARLLAIMDELNLVADQDFTHVGLVTYDMAPILEPYSGDALSLLVETALSQHARFYVRPATNEIVMRDDQPDITAVFDPDIAADGGDALDMLDCQFGYSDQDFLSRTVATLKCDETITHTSTHSDPLYIRSEEFLVDVLDRDQLAAWNIAPKLSGRPPFMPTTLHSTDVAFPFQNLLPLSLVTVKIPNRDTVTTVAVTSIKHELTPRRWTYELGFCSRLFVDMQAPDEDAP